MGIPLALVNRSVNLPFTDFRLSPGTYTLGRSRSCQLTVRDQSVSRKHAELTVHEACLKVVDLQSRNGTFIDGQTVTSARVSPGQELQFGRVKFLLVDLNRGPNLDDSDVETKGSAHTPQTPVQPLPVRSVLTEMQIVVLNVLIEGLTERQISEKLQMNQNTVRTHIRNIYEQLNVGSRPELMAKFIPRNVNGITTPPAMLLLDGAIPVNPQKESAPSVEPDSKT